MRLGLIDNMFLKNN